MLCFTLLSSRGYSTVSRPVPLALRRDMRYDNDKNVMNTVYWYCSIILASSSIKRGPLFSYCEAAASWGQASLVAKEELAKRKTLKCPIYVRAAQGHDDISKDMLSRYYWHKNTCFYFSGWVSFLTRFTTLHHLHTMIIYCFLLDDFHLTE